MACNLKLPHKENTGNLGERDRESETERETEREKCSHYLDMLQKVSNSTRASKVPADIDTDIDTRSAKYQLTTVRIRSIF